MLVDPPHISTHKFAMKRRVAGVSNFGRGPNSELQFDMRSIFAPVIDSLVLELLNEILPLGSELVVVWNIESG